MTFICRARQVGLAVAAAALLAAAAAPAQQGNSIAWNPRSGDAWVDRQLDDVNRYGARYQQPFVDEVVRYFGAPRELVTQLLGARRWAPGDVYYACAIAATLGRACREVVDAWERDHGLGWGEVARNLGIAPGTAQFHRLKRGFVPTYNRWGRPIDVDADLAGEFPRRDGAAAVADRATVVATVRASSHAAREPTGDAKPLNAVDKGKSRAGDAPGKNRQPAERADTHNDGGNKSPAPDRHERKILSADD